MGLECLCCSDGYLGPNRPSVPSNYAALSNPANGPASIEHQGLSLRASVCELSCTEKAGLQPESGLKLRVGRRETVRYDEVPIHHAKA